jgi:hypothetical protein
VYFGYYGIFWGEFGHIRVFGVILVILGVRYYFGHYGVSRVILVILEFLGLFWLFKVF